MPRAMQTCAGFLLLLLIAATSCSAIPKDHKDRRHDPELSDIKHDEEGDHNPDYDHDAFLGRDEAKKFDELTPEESKRRLGVLVDKIDTDKDGKVTNEELKTWITDVQRRYITSDSEKSWTDHDTADDKLTWVSYMKRTYGFGENENLEEDTHNAHYKDMITRDKRRWDRADQDKDTHLNKDEFINFLHPEDVPHMKDLVVLDATVEI